jgi:hypothetical protein
VVSPAVTAVRSLRSPAAKDRSVGAPFVSISRSPSPSRCPCQAASTRFTAYREQRNSVWSMPDYTSPIAASTQMSADDLTGILRGRPELLRSSTFEVAVTPVTSARIRLAGCGPAWRTAPTSTAAGYPPERRK